MAQGEGAQWRLGPATASLAARYQVSFDISANIEPALRKLSDSTGHDASFFVQEGNRRVRLVKVMFPDAQHSRTSRVGESMPLDRGAAGKVMLAAMGTQGKLYDDIRSRGFHVTVAEAKKLRQASPCRSSAAAGAWWVRCASARVPMPMFRPGWRALHLD